MTSRNPRRRGFAMVLVLVFVTLIFGTWGVAARYTTSMIRIEQARASRVRRDAARLPALSALARGIAALEVGFPPSSPHTCSIPGRDGSRFLVTFLRDPEDTSSWQVSVAPGADDAVPLLDESLFGVEPPASGI